MESGEEVVQNGGVPNGEVILTESPATEHLAGLTALIGQERALNEITQTLHFLADGLRPDTVGAIHVTCADESEMECAEAFQKGFAHYLLPPLKFAHRSPIRLANLGGQYEWGAVRFAEQHYTAPRGFKLVVVKINSHVGAQSPTESRLSELPSTATRLGVLRRYDVESPCCGALDAFLSGSAQPFTQGLRELMSSEGLDRESLLGDAAKVDPDKRLLTAALVASRLQARKAALDIQDYVPSTPTYWLVVSCVTLNRAARDTEIVCGFYVVDAREGDLTPTYYGLGDDPSEYRIAEMPHGFVVEEENGSLVRPGRDHRALALEQWRRHPPSPIAVNGRLDEIRREVAADKHRDERHAKALLRLALPILAEVAPVPVAVLLFAEGALGIRHAFQVHALTEELEGSEEARVILRDVHTQIDQLPPDRAEALIELLLKEYSSS